MARHTTGSNTERNTPIGLVAAKAGVEETDAESDGMHSQDRPPENKKF